MVDATDFFKLEPRDTSGSSRNLTELATEEEKNQIENLRSDFLTSCGQNSERPLIRYERLLNKVAFALDLNGVVSPDVVDALLCDRNTLFSFAYAKQQRNHQIARKRKEMFGRTTHEQRESA